jgi:hypothetical protein
MEQIFSTDLVGVKQSVVDEILLLSPAKTPMINLLGFGPAIAQTQHQWFEDAIFADKTKLAGAVDAAAVELTVEDVEPFRTNQVIKVEEERILVLTVDTVGKKLAVQRGYAGTTAAAHAVGVVAEVMFSDTEEGMDARSSRYKKRVPKDNVTQIFSDSIRLSGTAQEIAQYGITDLYSYEKAKVQLGQALELEKAVINGVKYVNGEKRYMRGVRDFIQTNVVEGAGATLTDDMINDLAQSVFDATGVEAAGGNYKLIVSPKQKRLISDFGKAEIRLTRQDNGRGQVVDHYTSDFGDFEIVMNPNLDPNEIILLDANRATIRPVANREFFHKFLGDKGDYVEGMITGEYTLEFLQEEAHARIRNLG